MASITCSVQPFMGFRLFKRYSIPQTPIAPSLGAPRTPQRLQQHVGALSMNADDMQPQGFFSAFTQPDVPADRKVQAPRPTVPIKVVKPEDDETDFQTKLGKPRFRSALEQVSYLTNETAMRRR